MIKKNFIIILLLIFVIISFMESYDVRGVEELAYVIAIGIDKAETPDNIVLTVQIATTGSQETGGTSSLETKLLSVETTSVGIGFSILNNLSTNELNLSHCSAIIFSEELAREGINPHINNLANNIEIRPTANIIISNNKAQDFLIASSAAKDISAKYYNSLLESSETTSYVSMASLSNFYAALHDDVRQPIAVYGYSDGSDIENLGISVFENDKFIGKLSGVETIMHNIFTNKLDSSTISLTSPIDNKSILDIKISLDKNTQISVNYDETTPTPTPTLNCDIYLEGKILSAARNYSFTNSEEVALLEEAINKKIMQEATNYLNKISHEYNSDIVGFYGFLKRNYLTYEELNNINWYEAFKNSTFNIRPNIRLTSNYLFPRV